MNMSKLNKTELLEWIDNSLSLNPDTTTLRAVREYCQMQGIKYTEEIATKALDWQFQELENITYGTPYFN